MAKVRRAFLSGTKLSSYKVFDDRTRRACKCCSAIRQPDQRFSNNGYCIACSTQRLLSSYGDKVQCEHWEVTDTGQIKNHHARLTTM